MINCTVALMRSASFRLVRSLKTFIKGAAMVDFVLMELAPVHKQNRQLRNETQASEVAVD